MRLSVILRTFGVLFLLFSTTLLPPIAISFYYDDGELARFSITFGISLLLGAAFWLPFYHHPAHIRSRDGFVIVALMWSAMGLLGAVPFMLALDASFADAFFESVSGYTTTGATVFVGLDQMSESILFYRQEIQWLGGIGVIVLAIALLPMLGIGGMQLYKAETPGPFKDERITPRITRTARNVCGIYVLLTAICALCYWLAGMNLFDAVGHSFSTLATGGYSSHDASLAYFNSPLIETVAIVFMLIGGISFNAHFVAWRTLQLQRYGQDSQTRVFMITVLFGAIATTAVLVLTRAYPTFTQSFRYGLFEVASVITTTGFSLADFTHWPLALPVLLTFIGFIGGCAGSTSGGIKVIRFMILGKQAAVHVHKLIHPAAVRRIKIDGHVVSDSVIESVGGFFAIYVGAFAVFMMLAMMDGMDQVSAFGAVAACLNNVGPGLGTVATTFLGVSDQGKVMFAVAMLFGRLEIFTFLVLLTPAFWKR
ncbi:MAG TPA: TrkH family potassium uptake protein [Gammaproteobacteria bacterium]|nr:TrkH family potassium uptake protein [Gammaproteobacteria bacterium]